MSKQKKYHYIYKTTCKITGKFYVGMHSTDNLEDSYIGSGKILGYSISKHGKENHLKEILEHCSSREELKLREKEIVNEELLLDPLCLNLKNGGEGGGKFWSKDQQVNASIAGNKSPKRDHRSIASKILATKIIRDSFHRPTNVNRIGTTNSETQKARQKATFKERGHAVGEKNSNFGKCWINDGKKAITIQKELLQEYLMNGFSRGRKINDV